MDMAQYMKLRKIGANVSVNSQSSSCVVPELEPKAKPEVNREGVAVSTIVREPMAPRGYAGHEVIDRVLDSDYFARMHRNSRNGRRGKRPAQKPRYKSVRRDGLRFRKHAR